MERTRGWRGPEDGGDQRMWRRGPEDGEDQRERGEAKDQEEEEEEEEEKGEEEFIKEIIKFTE
jgi:hypothetical protein